MQIIKICHSKYICEVGCIQITLNMNNSGDTTSHLDCVCVFYSFFTCLYFFFTCIKVDVNTYRNPITCIKIDINTDI